MNSAHPLLDSSSRLSHSTAKYADNGDDSAYYKYCETDQGYGVQQTRNLGNGAESFLRGDANSSQFGRYWNEDADRRDCCSYE